MSDDRTPHVWLWDELVQRLGKEAALALHDAYTARMRQYNRDKHFVRPKPVQHRTRLRWRIRGDEEER